LAGCRLAPAKRPGSKYSRRRIDKPGNAGPARSFVTGQEAAALRAPHQARPAGGTAMAQFHVIAGASERPAHPVIRKISTADLREALKHFAEA